MIYKVFNVWSIDVTSFNVNGKLMSYCPGFNMDCLTLLSLLLMSSVCFISLPFGLLKISDSQN
ncbi:MAG: hypothetical protein ACTS44_00635 [Candidatus Hodgkinia cicadicola]